MTNRGDDVFAQARRVPLHKLLGIDNKSMQIACPFPEHHAEGDKHKSAHYYPDSNRVKCFTEDKSWGPVDFVAEKRGMEPLAAARWLVEQHGEGGLGWMQDRLARQLQAVENQGVAVNELLLDGLEGSCDDSTLRRHVAAQREIAKDAGSIMVEMTETEVQGLIEMKKEADDGTDDKNTDTGQAQGDEEAGDVPGS